MNSLLNTILTIVTLTDAGVYFVSGNIHVGKVPHETSLLTSHRTERQSISKHPLNKHHLLNVITDKRHKRQALPTVPTTTSPPMPTTMVVTTPRLGCKHGSKWYNPGQEIYRGRSDNWCYAAYCGNDGHIIYADDFNCVTTTTTPATTMPQTTIPNGCFYQGKWYGPGQEVYRGQSGNWCYFAHCEYGHVQHADNFNCNPTTLPPTTTPELTPPTTIPSGCMFEGKWYRPGQEIYNRQTGSWCYSAYCDYSGQILHGDNFNCVTSHSTVPTTSANTAPLIHVG